MPSKTDKQAAFMAIACHDKEFAKKNGIDQKTACEFHTADKTEESEKPPRKSREW